MVRTVGTTIKSTGGKSSKGAGLSGGSSFSSGGLRSSKRSIGGNKLVQRPVPQWQKPIGSFFAKSESNSTSPEADREKREKPDQCLEESYEEEHAEFYIDDDEDKENREQPNSPSEEVAREEEVIEEAVDMFDGAPTYYNVSEDDEVSKSPAVLAEHAKHVDEEVNVGASTSSYKPAAPKASPPPPPKRKVEEQLKTEAQPAKKRKVRPQYHLLEKIEREYSSV